MLIGASERQQILMSPQGHGSLREREREEPGQNGAAGPSVFGLKNQVWALKRTMMLGQIVFKKIFMPPE